MRPLPLIACALMLALLPAALPGNAAQAQQQTQAPAPPQPPTQPPAPQPPRSCQPAPQTPTT